MLRGWFQLLLLLLCVVGCTPQAPKFNATDVTNANWGQDFHLTDASGKSRQLADFKGKAVVLFFGYTQCPDICPTAMTKLSQVMKLLGDDAERLQVIFVTVDPERDTPELLAQYVPAFDKRFIGLYGDLETTASTAKNFKVFYQKQLGSAPGRYTMDHSSGLYVYDPQGRLRLFVRDGELPEKIAADLKVLLAGK